MGELKVVNPFATGWNLKSEPRETSPERSVKRFKVESEENSRASLEPPNNIRVFAVLSKGNNSNISIPTETSFANDSKILSSTRQNIEPNRINTTR